LSKRTAVLSAMLALLTALSLGSVLFFTQGTEGAAQGQDGLIPEDVAITKAIAAARFGGLKGDPNFAARLMTLSQYAELMGGATRR